MLELMPLQNFFQLCFIKPGLAIHFAAMAHTVDAHNPDGIGNFLNHPVVTHADAPVVFAAGQFAATKWARVACKRLNGHDNTVMNSGGKTPHVALG